MQDYRKNAICRIIAILVKIALVDNLQNKTLIPSSVYKQVETVTKSLYQLQVINVSLWEMEIIKNYRGGQKLCIYGFKFTRKTYIRWECSDRRLFNCKGSLCHWSHACDIIISVTYLLLTSSRYVGGRVL